MGVSPYFDGKKESIIVLIIVPVYGAILAAMLFSTIEEWIKLLSSSIWTVLLILLIGKEYHTGLFLKKHMEKRMRGKYWQREGLATLKLFSRVTEAVRNELDPSQSGTSPNVTKNLFKSISSPQNIFDNEFPAFDSSASSFKRRLEYLTQRRDRIEREYQGFEMNLEDEFRDMIRDLIILHDDFISWSESIFLKLKAVGVKAMNESPQRKEFEDFRMKVLNAVSKIDEMIHDFDGKARRIGSVEIGFPLNKRQFDDILPR